MQSAILWYDTFKNFLEGIGFKMNRYDPCVVNIEVDRKQCTIYWYVDDMKISHMDHQAVDDIISKIEDEFGKMTVTRGKVHRFLDIDIDFENDRTIWITMIDYLTECFDAFGEPIDRRENTPAKHILFDVFDE